MDCLKKALIDPRSVDGVLSANHLTHARRLGRVPAVFDVLDGDAVLFTGRSFEIADWLRKTGRVHRRLALSGLQDEATAAGLALIAEQGPALAASEIDPAPGLSPSERRR